MGGFTRGFHANVIDFKGNRLKERELDLRERALDQARDEEEGKIKQSAVKVSAIDPKFADKFKPGQEELLRKLQVFAAENANALNNKNTADDNIEGVFDPEIAAKYRNMELEIMRFAQHSVDYVTAYKGYHDKVYELDKFLHNKYNLDMVAQDPVYLTEGMVTGNMGEGQTMDDYSWMWNADGSANTDGMGQQTALKDENGAYQYQIGPNGEKFLLGINGQKLIAYGEDSVDGSINKVESGTFTFERIYNEDYDNNLLTFDDAGNIVYGEVGNQVAFYDKWNKNFTKLDEHKYSTDALWEIGNDLTFDLIRDEEQGGLNKYITNETFDNMRSQLQGIDGVGGVAAWNPTGGADRKGAWSNQYSEIAARQAAEQILISQGNKKPTPEAIDEVVDLIKQRGGAKLPEALIKTSSHGTSGYKIETYEDYYTELILDRWKTKHANIDVVNSADLKTSTKGLDVWLRTVDWNTANQKSTEIKISSNEIFTNDAGNIHTLDVDFSNKARSWGPIHMDGDAVKNIESINDVGFQAFNPTLTSILQKGAATGKLTAGEVSHRAIDKRTGKLMLNAEWDKTNQRFVFTTQEDAENAIIVPGFEGYWKADNAEDIRKLYPVTNEGIIDSSKMTNWQKLTIEEILRSDKGIPGFFPINSTTLSNEEIKYLKDFIDQTENMKKVILNENSGEYEAFTMNEKIIDDEWDFPGLSA